MSSALGLQALVDSFFFFLYEWWRSELSSLGLPRKHFTNSPAPGCLSLLLEGDDLVFTVIQVSSEDMAKNNLLPIPGALGSISYKLSS